MFCGEGVVKSTCADSFEGEEVSPMEVGEKRAREEWKSLRKRGEKERVDWRVFEGPVCEGEQKCA